MKKLVYIFSLLALVLCAYSCQNSIDTAKESLTITATIAEPDASRVELTDNGETLRPEWSEGDKVIGFDEGGNTFEFTVESVTDRRATMNAGGYAAVNGRKVYAIYAPGYKKTAISDNKLAVSIESQNGGLDMSQPFLMCATATVDGSNINLVFENQVAVVGLKKFKINPVAATNVDHLVLNGAVASGTFQIVDSKLQLVTSGSPAPITAAGTWTTDASGVYDNPVYFAVLPTNSANLELHAVATNDKYVNLASIPETTLSAGYYYRMSKILDAVADVDGVKYDSIDAAWAAANVADTPVTVTLLANCRANAALTLNDSGSGAVTLDLNGKTLTGRTGVYAISAQNSRSLTIVDTDTDGTISTDYRGVNKASGATLAITGGKIESAQQCVYAEGSGVAVITGGLFHSQSAAAVTSDGSTARIHGGKFSSNSKTTALMAITNSGKLYVWEPTCYDRPLTSNRTAKNDGGSTYIRYNTLSNDENYPFTIGTISSADAIITTVSGSANPYRSDMAAAARHAKMARANITLSPNGNNTTPHPAVDLTNDEGHTVTLDLVGKTMTTTTASFLTTSGTLVITDTESTKGKITSNKQKILAMGSNNGSVSIRDCVIECTLAPSTAGTAQYAIHINGGTTKHPSVTIENNAVIHCTDTCRAFYVYYGNLTLNSCEVTGGTDTEIKRQGGRLVYVSTGGNVEINENASLRHLGSEAIIHSGSGNGATHIVINGGYFYSNGMTLNAGGSDYGKVYEINGGYYNKDFRLNGSMSKANYGEGKSFQEITPATNTHSTTSETLSYNYQVKDTPSESEAQASTTEPVASYGTARTGGVSF